jgi:hypothetical protein
MPQFPFPSEPADSTAVLNFLKKHPFVKHAEPAGEDCFTVELFLDHEATDILVQYLSASRHGQATYAQSPASERTTTVRISSEGKDKTRFKRELTLAFNKVSQFLEYQELKREYASGQVPFHLSQWLLENNVFL